MPSGPPLAFDGYAERITAAMRYWEDENEMQGRGVNQSLLHRQLVSAYGDRAPALVSVSKWLRTRQPPAPEFQEMWAAAFGVRPAWLYFADGPMVAGQGGQTISGTADEVLAALEGQKPKRRHRTG